MLSPGHAGPSNFRVNNDYDMNIIVDLTMELWYNSSSLLMRAGFLETILKANWRVSMGEGGDERPGTFWPNVTAQVSSKNCLTRGVSA
jgi:hypothetical protein